MQPRGGLPLFRVPAFAVPSRRSPRVSTSRRVRSCARCTECEWRGRWFRRRGGCLLMDGWARAGARLSWAAWRGMEGALGCGVQDADARRSGLSGLSHESARGGQSRLLQLRSYCKWGMWNQLNQPNNNSGVRKSGNVQCQGIEVIGEIAEDSPPSAHHTFLNLPRPSCAACSASFPLSTRLHNPHLLHSLNLQRFASANIVTVTPPPIMSAAPALPPTPFLRTRHTHTPHPTSRRRRTSGPRRRRVR